MDQETGYWLKLPEELSSFSILCLSQSGNKVFVSGGNGDFSGSYTVDLASGEFEEFKTNLDGFTPPLSPAAWNPVFYPLAWSPNEEWFVIETYDPENPPKDYTDVVPSALYMLSKDGSEAKLIIRNIEGRVISVVFSPDGSKIAWVEQYADGNQSIHIANSDGSGTHEIFSNTGLSSDYNITSNLIWSPDGNRLVFVGYRSKDLVYPFWVLTLGQAKIN